MEPRSRQGRAILAALHELDHPTADEIFQHVRGALPRISLATVYRNLDGLVENGVAQVRQIGAQKRYDAKTDPHIHLHCVRCDRLVDAPLDDALEAALRRLAAQGGMQYQDALLEVRGLCRECRKETP